MSTLNFHAPTDLLCAQLCQLSYENKRTIEATITFSEAKLIDYYSDNDLDAQAFTAVHDDVMYVVFRGSESAMDWVVNSFLFKKTHYVHGIPTKVHRGFYEALNRISDRIFDHAYYHTGKLVVCGHSLGGAMSTIFASMLPLFKHTTLEHYTFGSPRVGNREFARAFGSMGFVSKRYVNGSDVVCRIPPPVMNFKHVGTRVDVNHDGGPIRDHYIANYIEAIKKGA